jgi:hypothetical protein
MYCVVKARYLDQHLGKTIVTSGLVIPLPATTGSRRVFAEGRAFQANVQQQRFQV